MTDTLTIPDALPVLSKGNHVPGSGRACIMDAISLLSGRDYDLDHPRNVLPVLNPLFIGVNDAAGDVERQELWPLGIRAMGTATPDDPDVMTINHKVVVSLLIMQSMRHLGNDSPGEHAEGVDHLGTALRWLNQPNYAARMSAYSIPHEGANSAHCLGCHFARHAARSLMHSKVGTETLVMHLRGCPSHAARMAFLGQVMDDVEGVLGTSSGAPTEAGWHHVRDMITNPTGNPVDDASGGLVNLTVATVAQCYGLPQYLLASTVSTATLASIDWSIPPSTYCHMTASPDAQKALVTAS